MMSDKLKKLMNKLADEPFEWGKNDCFTFTNSLVKEYHGHDYRKLHPYQTKKEAEDYMEQHGGIEALTVGTLGYPVAAEHCVDGDVALADLGNGDALGFVFNGNALFKSKKKLVKIPLSKCLRGWRIR